MLINIRKGEIDAEIADSNQTQPLDLKSGSNGFFVCNQNK